MDQETLNKIVSFNWGNADHVLRDRKSRDSHPPLRTRAKSGADILAIERTDKGLLDRLLA